MDSLHITAVIVVVALSVSHVYAADPGPLQDFCVSTNKSDDGVYVNGMFCKDPKYVTADDFSFSGLHIPGNTSNPVQSIVTLGNVDLIPGLNTLGISLARVDFAPYGVNAPHIHPRASEIFYVAKGTLYVGFITANPEHRLFSKILREGDVFVNPLGLIHFQYNLGNTSALGFASLTSQNPGVITVANTIFGSNPPIHDYVLTKAFQLDKKIVDELQAKF